MRKQKVRLDQLVVERYPAISRTQAQSLIMQGRVTAGGVVVVKSGTLVAVDAEVAVAKQEQGYVSRAGHKLKKGLDAFNVVVAGKVALDAGISTGGFTDCLLQQGITKVYGVDVGYGLVHESIRSDPRVTLYERTNLRFMEPLPEQVDLVTLDLSFISVLKVMPVVIQNLKAGGELLVLIKPQFEAGRHQVGPGGIITDPAVHAAVIKRLTGEIEQLGFVGYGAVPSPILGGSGNQEFIAYFTKK